jgi:MoaA/NifB/PqqE/SkfB family radical SAM enzyme
MYNFITDNSDLKFVFRYESQFVSHRITQVYIEMSTHCNLSCRSCVRNSIADFEKLHFSPDMMRKLLPMLAKLKLDRIVLLGFGEALCNPDIEYLLKSLRRLKTKIVLVTNATFLTEAMSSFLVGLPLDELYVSWDDDIEGGNNIIRQGMQVGVFRTNLETLFKIKAASSDARPRIGMQLIATKSNFQFIPQNIAYGNSIGIEKFIVSNVFPYSSAMRNEILYELRSKPKIDLKEFLKNEIKQFNIKIANQSANITRNCPFIEKGTVFITSRGDVSPCPELAYTHPAFYFGSERVHNKYILGNINNQSLQVIWESKRYAEMRKNFSNYYYTDCSFCYRPDRCEMRTMESVDCYCNYTPCGECPWAKDILICP